MHTRRDFIKFSTALAAGGASAIGPLLESIGRAAAIPPTAGSSFQDAEHVVILMQENRSFDHTFGSLRGVRGFDDPRAIALPDGNPVWAQANQRGERYVPFRFDIQHSNATWMGCLPHGWTDQVDAFNGGLHDQWLNVKQSGTREYREMPLTMGYYNRADIPFYYALADAFTVCDQYFCSSLTGTTPNRLHLWTGTIRERQAADVPANVRNEEVDLNHLANWKTFPERLLELGVSWKVYQNELTVDSGLSDVEDSWLANFGDNPLEYFEQFHAGLAPRHRQHVDRQIEQLTQDIAQLTERLNDWDAQTPQGKELRETLAARKKSLAHDTAERDRFAGKSLDTLAAAERELHARAFCTNEVDPAFRDLAELTYQDGDTPRGLQVPRSDLFHQFRRDVNTGKLPTVSWLVAPQVFSDHPSSAWYGAWYIAEALDILTQNPDVWKKTVFILTYDENDGYFDHVPPFVAPRPGHPETGTVTSGIDASLEYVELEQDRRRQRASSIGLGYRVPMVVASPWSRGGCVCSQVLDHTSILQFLEKLLSQKLGRPVEEPNINKWRRTVCGDLTSLFQDSTSAPEAASAREGSVPFPPRDEFLESIHRAQFAELPTGYHALTAAELEALRRDPATSGVLPRQEPGVRPSCPLPYELNAEGSLMPDRKAFRIQLEAKQVQFGDRAAGAPFAVYALLAPDKVQVRHYAVEPGQGLEDAWDLGGFAEGRYHVRVHGPNGFYREFRGDAADPALELQCTFELPSAIPAGEPGPHAGPHATVAIAIRNAEQHRPQQWIAHDLSYGHGSARVAVAAGESGELKLSTAASHGWYDLGIRCDEHPRFVRRYAGRVETGAWSFSDPAIGRGRA